MWQPDLLVHSNCTVILFLWYLVPRFCFHCFQTNQQLSKFQKLHQKLTKENYCKNTHKFPWGNYFPFSLLHGGSEILLTMIVIKKDKTISFGKVSCDHTAISRALHIKNKYFGGQLLHAGFDLHWFQQKRQTVGELQVTTSGCKDVSKRWVIWYFLALVLPRE